jgi:hypothetical protein
MSALSTRDPFLQDNGAAARQADAGGINRRIAMRLRVALSVFAMCLPLAVAQAADAGHTAPDLDAQRLAMSKLAFLVGKWHGEGWIQGPNGRVVFHQTETIAMLQDGLLLAIEGRGFAPTDPAKPRFQANALVSYNDGSGEYSFYSYAQGNSGTFKAELLSPDTLRWYPGPVRFTISVDASGHWRETGEAPDGKGGMVGFFEMNLQRDP